MIVLVYNDKNNTIEKYTRSNGKPMPYIKNSYLTIQEFKGSSKTKILWTSRKTMEAFNTTRQRFKSSIYVGYAFKRIFEGGHSGQSQHYAGTAFDCGQKWSLAKRKDLYNLCLKLGVWGYVEPIRLTPTWVHMDKRASPSACSAGYPALSYGSVNNYVLILQDALIYLGYRIDLDGIYKNATKNAIISFQKKYKLTSDGVVGCQTWTKIVSLVTGKKPNSNVVYY